MSNCCKKKVESNHQVNKQTLHHQSVIRMVINKVVNLTKQQSGKDKRCD